MTKYIKTIVVSITLIYSTFLVNAQQAYPVNLDTVLKLAGANNLTIQEYQLKYQQSLAEQSKSNEWWLPNIYAGAITHYLSGAAMNTDGSIITDVNRNNLWSGLGIAAEIDFSKGIYQSLAAKQKSESVKYFGIAEKNKVILNAIQTYFDLQVEQLKYFFLQALVNQSDSLSQQIKIQVDAGLRYASEYLLAQSNYNHLKITMLQAKGEWHEKSALLANLLNLKINARLISGDTSLIPLAITGPPEDTTGYEKRSEFLGLSAELQSFQTNRRTVNYGFLIPKLNAGFDNGAFGAYENPLYNTSQFNASLLWTLPLGRLTYKGDLKQWETKILEQLNKIDQFKNQFNQETEIARAKLKTASSQMTIAKEALQLSKEALEQSIERQKLGTVKPFEVFQSQQFYLQAQVDYLHTISEYNKAQYELFIALGNNL